MKVLLDTNIVIHRETNHIINQDIGTLFRWLDKTHCEKIIHCRTVQEIEKNSNDSTVSAFQVKIQNKEQFNRILKETKSESGFIVD